VQVQFRTRQLERRFNNSRQATRAWGPVVGERYVERVEMLKAVEHFEHLYDIRMLDLHPLLGDRRSQYAIRLTGAVRLIISRDPVRAGVIVEEVTDYHG
jgi:plasmid maintenance system killer protein